MMKRLIVSLFLALVAHGGRWLRFEIGAAGRSQRAAWQLATAAHRAARAERGGRVRARRTDPTGERTIG